VLFDNLQRQRSASVERDDDQHLASQGLGDYANRVRLGLRIAARLRTGPCPTTRSRSLPCSAALELEGFSGDPLRLGRRAERRR